MRASTAGPANAVCPFRDIQAQPQNVSRNRTIGRTVATTTTTTLTTTTTTTLTSTSSQPKSFLHMTPGATAVVEKPVEKPVEKQPPSSIVEKPSPSPSTSRQHARQHARRNSCQQARQQAHQQAVNRPPTSKVEKQANPIIMSSPLSAMSILKFVGAQSAQQGNVEQARAVMRHLCASHCGVAGTEEASVQDAALLRVERFRAGDLTPTSFQNSWWGYIQSPINCTKHYTNG